jgi:hypothetical protein
MELGEKDYPTSLQELEAQRAHWTAERDQAAGYLAHMESTAARALLAGNSSHREALVSARQAVNEAEQVLAEIARQMPQARAVALYGRAKACKAEAEELEAEAAGIEASVDKLNVEIEKLEGVRYVLPPPLSRFGPPRVMARSQELRARAFGLTEEAGHLEGQADEILKKAEGPTKRKAVPIGWTA